MWNRKAILCSVFAVLFGSGLSAAPPETTSPKYLTLRHSGGWAPNVWELTVHQDGTVVYAGGKDGQYRSATYRISQRQLEALRSSIDELNRSGLPESVPGEGTDSPQLTCIEHLTASTNRFHALGLSAPESPASRLPQTKQFKKLWSRLVSHLGVPDLELPYGPKNLR